MLTSRRSLAPLLALATLASPESATLASPASAMPPPGTSSPAATAPACGVVAGRQLAVLPLPAEDAAREAGLETWARDGDLVLVGGAAAAIDRLAARGTAPLLRLDDAGEWLYLLEHDPGLRPPAVPGAGVLRLDATRALYRFPPGARVELPAVKPRGAFRAVPRRALARLSPHPADLAARAGALAGPRRSTAANPLVQAIVDATDQARWFQDVKDLSGENVVVIGGTRYAIATRFSDAMFPPAANAYATEYLLDRGQSWGYDGVREAYTAADSGCGSQGKEWQNVVFTLPGQVDFAGHQQVLFVNHYDTISYDPTQNSNYSPGADDAISGGCALLEALRTFRNYAFRNTVKVIFFSGEELGLCGSIAYTNQHSSRDMWRAVNMDQTAFDGNGDRVMNLWNWDATYSPASVDLGQSFLDANTSYGPIIDPARISVATWHMCQTDHCPFWNVGVGAIALTEDFADTCPCFDQLQTPTCHDTVTQIWNAQPMFNPDYSWPTEKAAVAVVAALADPLYACPAAPPAVAATPGNGVVHLGWAAIAGVSPYVIERGVSCAAGGFTPLASVAGTSWDDTSVVNGTTYAYRIRTCPTQVGACIEATPLPGPGAVYQVGSATVGADTSGDGIVQNCETARVDLQVVNDGDVPLTGVRVTSVSAASPAVRVLTGFPVTVGDLAVGASGPASFRFVLGRDGTSAACGEASGFAVTTDSREAPPETRTFSLETERAAKPGPLTYPFDTGLDGWTVTSGDFTLRTGGAPGSTAGHLESRTLDLDCDAIESPLLLPGPSSQLSLWVDWDIESGDYDRAVVRAVDLETGAETALTPSSAAPYSTSVYAWELCDDVGRGPGWSGNSGGWLNPTFDLSPFAGRVIRIELRYATDEGTTGVGLWLDQVQVTGTTELDCDATSDVCAGVPGEVSPPGAAQPFWIANAPGGGYALRFSETPNADRYDVYPGTLGSLRAGVFDHSAAAGLCGLLDGTPGDGIVDVTVPDLPAGSYLLAVGESAQAEGPYGRTGDGSWVPEARTTCP